MIELHEWIASTRFADKPWLVLGKGPTFLKLDEVDRSAYNTMGLNHVAAHVPVDVVHVIDVDVIESAGEAIAANARWVVMPRVPHVQQLASLLRLEDFVASNAVLRRLEEERRLVWYNATTAPPVGASRPVEVRYFSSEAAIGILARMGVRAIRSLGIDGGRSYSPGFSRSTLLANGQPSFDLQFERIDAIVEASSIDYAPLVEPVRVFIGLDDSQVVAAQVLEHSIRTHTSRPVRVVHMRNRPVPMPKDPKNRPRTGFSFSRFLIPELCGYKGRAIYLDADMQVFADIGHLWDQSFDGASLLCTNQPDVPEGWKDNAWFHPGPQMSVMLLDCERLQWDIREIVGGLDDGRYNYQELMFDMCIVPEGQLQATLPPEWNHLERYDENITRLTHYTIVPTQPWKNDENPLCDVWQEGFNAAVDDSAVSPADLEEGVRHGHVKRSLLDRLAARPMPPGDTSAVALEIAALRQRLDDLEGGFSRRLRVRSEVWRKRAAYAGESARPVLAAARRHASSLVQRT